MATVYAHTNDGYARAQSTTSFAHCRDNSGASFWGVSGITVSTQGVATYKATARGAATWYIYRSFFYFDTSGITGTVDSATLKIYGRSYTTGDLIVSAGSTSSTVFRSRFDSTVFNNAANNQNQLVLDGGIAKLYASGAEKFRTTSAGILVTGNITAGDNQQLQLGANGDLRLYHDGSSSYVRNTLANNTLFLQSAGNVVIENTNGSNYFKGEPSGAATLYHNGSSKLATTSGGATVTGTLTATSFSGDGSNLTGVSGAEIYGFNTDTNGNLIVTTTNGGADNISGTTFDAFEDVVFAATGFSFSVNANGKLIATI